MVNEPDTAWYNLPDKRSMETASYLTSLEGVVERITYSNEENGYTIARLQPAEDRELVTIVGSLPSLNVGESLRLQGRWATHPRFGRQFQVERYQVVLPANVEGIRRYLGSGLIKGIGPVTAGRIVDHFGLETLEVIEQQPKRLREVPGLGYKRAEMITQAWEAQKVIQEVMVFLQSLQISSSLAVRIYKHYGDASPSIVQKEPYRMAREVFGIGFLTADKIARSVGIRHRPDLTQAGEGFLQALHGHLVALDGSRDGGRGDGGDLGVAEKQAVHEAVGASSLVLDLIRQAVV